MDQRDTSDGKRKGLLEDLSMSQVLAGALAAVTSVALSSRIGIAGSLIGVAVASVVSTVASQLYRGMLRRANDKIRELAANDDESSAAESSNPYGLGRSSDSVVREASDRASAPSGVRIAPAELRAAAHRRRQEKIHRRVIVAAVVSSLAAVAISAGVVLLATNGEGLGQRTGAAATQESETAAATAEHHSALTEQTRPKTQQEPATSASSSAGSSTSNDGNASGDATNATTTGSNTGADQATTPEQDQASTAASTATAAE